MKNLFKKEIPTENELVKLLDKLSMSDEDTGHWELVSMSADNFEAPQVIFYDDEGNRIADAVCHPLSYGHEQGLIEIMGEPLCYTDDDVEGWLTADTVFSRWMNYLKERA